MLKTILSMMDFWDYVMFGSFFIVGIFCFALVLFVLGLPGKIAIARNHPDAEAVNLMGWVGFLAIVPWIQALIWAFKPTDVVDTAAALQPGTAGLFLLIRKMTGDNVLADIKGIGGTVMKTSFDETKERALRDALAGLPSTIQKLPNAT
jgi:hypothetical protein